MIAGSKLICRNRVNASIVILEDTSEIAPNPTNDTGFFQSDTSVSPAPCADMAPATWNFLFKKIKNGA